MKIYSLTPRKLLSLLFLFLLYNLPAQEVPITGKEAGFDFRGEYNRALLYEIDFAALGAVEFNKHYTLRGGLSMGSAGGGFDIKTFVQGKIGPLPGIPVYASLAYIYNGLPEWESHTHTVLPLLSYNGQRVGITIGPALRFNRFFGKPSQFESAMSFSAYVNFINNENFRIGMGLANFNDFNTRNTGAWSILINSSIRFNEQWSLINDIEFLQSGSESLAANFYGIAYRGGLRFRW